MKAVFVTDVSPAKGHIYGLRVSSFARAMIRRGHRTVVFGPTHAPNERPVPPDEFGSLVAGHSWTAPLFVTAMPVKQPLLEAARSGRLPGPMRKALTASMIALEGGVHGDWERGARPLADALATQFRPDVVWSVFGNASTLIVGQKLARAALAPWFMDIKDNWESYTPPALRRVMAWRFADAAGYTSNAELHGDIAARWLSHERRIIYSGVADMMQAPHEAEARRDVCLFTLIGSTYRAEMVDRFVSSLAAWLLAIGPDKASKVRFRYAGTSHDMVGQALARTNPGCRCDVTGNIAHAELAHLCHSAMANCYLWAPFGFHHKLMELLATRRPAISFPGEHAESVRLAAETGGELRLCANEAELASCFEDMYQRWQRGNVEGSAVDAKRISWDAGAAKLEAFFSNGIWAHTNRTMRL